MLSEELLKILCCPACKGDLSYDREHNILTCGGCHRVYEVNDDIPNLLVDDDTEQTGT